MHIVRECAHVSRNTLILTFYSLLDMTWKSAGTVMQSFSIWLRHEPVSQGTLFFFLLPTRVNWEISSSTPSSLTRFWWTRAPPTTMTQVCSLLRLLASTSSCLLPYSVVETTTICGTSWSMGTGWWHVMLRYTRLNHTGKKETLV